MPSAMADLLCPEILMSIISLNNYIGNDTIQILIIIIIIFIFIISRVSTTKISRNAFTLNDK